MKYSQPAVAAIINKINVQKDLGLPELRIESGAIANGEEWSAQALNGDFAATFSELHPALVKHIGPVMIVGAMAKNPLELLEREIVDTAATVEEIFIKGHRVPDYKFKKNGESSDLLEKQHAEVAALYSSENFRKRDRVTINEAEMRRSLSSIDQLMNFTAQTIATSIANITDEKRIAMMTKLNQAIADNLIVIETSADDPTSKAGLEVLIQKAVALVMNMTGERSSDYNAYRNWEGNEGAPISRLSMLENIMLILPNELIAGAKVQLWANNFNMDQAQFLGHVIGVKGFAEPGVRMVIGEMGALRYHPTTRAQRQFDDGSDLSVTYFFHERGIMRLSGLHNLVAFVSDNNSLPVIETDAINAPNTAKVGEVITYQTVPANTTIVPTLSGTATAVMNKRDKTLTITGAGTLTLTSGAATKDITVAA